MNIKNIYLSIKWKLFCIGSFIPILLIGIGYGLISGLVFYYYKIIRMDMSFNCDRILLKLNRGLFIAQDSPIYNIPEMEVAKNGQ